MNTKTSYRELKGYKYQLVEDFKYQIDIVNFSANIEDFVQLNEEGWLSIKKGYAWDGASGPTIDTLNSMRGSLVHDALYQLLRMNKLPQSQIVPADVVFRKIIIADGMSSFRAWIWYRGLRLANGSAAKPGTQKDNPVIIAP